MNLLTMDWVVLVLPLIEGRQEHWRTWTWACLAAAAALFLLFGLYEHRLGQRDRAPLVNLTLFRGRAFTVGLFVQLFFWTGQASFFLVLALLLRQGRGLRPREGGAIIRPLGLGHIVPAAHSY